ncbi:MAG: amidohydrolase family protein, partial [Acidobacteria bacterium]|nr:amidohydrolase family protein [Acidobacteriota bacterium]
FGSDWPIVSCDVREGVHHAVRRRPWTEGDTDQHVTLEQALGAYTTAAASTEYSSKRKGKVHPGMLADLVVLSGDVRDLAVEPPSPIEVRLTICNGSVVYDASDE